MTVQVEIATVALIARLEEEAAGRHRFSQEDPYFTFEEGRKYLKVIYNSYGSRSVHAFVDKVSGDLYKAASWNAPAKGIRYNLLNNPPANVDPNGSYLYR